MMRSYLKMVLAIAAVAIYATSAWASGELLENNDIETESRFTPHGTPGVDDPNGFADYWHHSANATWSDPATDPFVSGSHSLKIADDNNGGLANGREEMRSFATGIPGVGNANRSLEINWEWYWDITAGTNFSAFIRISDAPAVTLDLAGNIVDNIYLTDGTANSNGFQSFSTSIPLAASDASFDIIFRTTEDPDGAQAETGVMFVDDVFAHTIPEPASMLLLSIGGILVMGRRQRG